MHICGFEFDVVNMEDDSFFLEDRFSAIDRDLKNKKIMVPMNPEGGARTGPRAPRLTPCVQVWQTSNLRRLRLGEEKKKERRKKKIEETTGQKYNVRICYARRP